MTNQVKYRPDIDGLRAISIILVVLFHYFPNEFQAGFIGVDVFFVISGFLITSIIINQSKNNEFYFIKFYENRIKRLFPALILIYISLLAFGWFAFLSDEYANLGKHIVASSFFVQNLNIVFESGYFDTSAELKPLLNLWSLSVEEQFYLIYPPALILAAKYNKEKHFIFISLFTFFILNIISVEISKEASFFLPHVRFWELIAGATCFYFRKYFVKNTNNYYNILGLILIGSAFFFIDKNSKYPGYLALFPVIGSCLIISNENQDFIKKHILQNKALVFIGLVSYSLYLWHWTILSLARIVYDREPYIYFKILLIVISMFMSVASYFIIEKPFRYGKFIKYKSPLLILSAAIISIIGGAIFLKGGLDFRFPPSYSEPIRSDVIRDEINCTNNLNLINCYQSLTEKPSTVVIGDSHSEKIYISLAAKLKNSISIIHLTKPGCPPIINLEIYQNTENEACLEYMNKAFSYISKTETIKNVILVSRGPLYLTGKGYGTSNQEPKYNWKIYSAANMQKLTFSDAFKFELKNTIDLLEKKGKNVILLKDVPELGFDPRSCFPLKYFDRMKDPCGLNFEDYMKRSKNYSDIIDTIKNDYKDKQNIHVIDPISIFCDKYFCSAKIDGEVLYKDNNHLNLKGADKVTSIFINKIKQ